MEGYPDFIFLAILILQVIFLALLTRFTLRHNNLQHRVLVPMLALAGTGIIGGFLKQIGPDMGGIFLFMTPTLAILTLCPLFEQYVKIERKGLAIASLSVALTIAVFWYLFGMAFGGVGIFLPVAGISLFSGVWLEVRLVSLYIELLVLGGTLLGMIILGNEVVPKYFREPAFIVIHCMILSMATVLFNSLVVGFFVIFLYSLFQAIRSKAAGVLIPVIGATGVSYIISALPVTYQYTDVAAHYDPSLYILVLLALGVMTFVPLFFRAASHVYWNTCLYASTTLTVIILTLLSRSPGQDIFHAVCAGVSTLAGSGLFTPGTGLCQGMEEMMLLYAGAAVLSVVIFSAVTHVIILIRKRKDPASPSRLEDLPGKNVNE